MIKTVNIDPGATEQVVFDRIYPYFYIKNLSDSNVYATVDKMNFSAGDDDVTCVPAQSCCIVYSTFASDTVNIKSDSDTAVTAEVIAAYDNNINFFKKNTSKGGGTYDDTELRNYISDLQENKANASDLDKYVTKATGYGLSSNDFTTDEKNKLAGLENYDDSEIKAEIADSGWTNIDLITATTNLILDNTVSNYLNYRKIGHIVYVKGSMKFTSISDEDVVMENMTGVLPNDFKPEKAAVLLGRCGTFVNNNNSDFQPIYWQFNPSGSVSVSLMNNQKLSGAINKSVSVQGSYIID